MTGHDTRRLAIIRRTTNFRNLTDDALLVYLESALSVFLDYTHRSADPGEPIDYLICDIAKWQANRQGAEGVKKAKDGEMEREWELTAAGIPMELTARMKMYRQVIGVGNATPKL